MLTSGLHEPVNKKRRIFPRPPPCPMSIVNRTFPTSIHPLVDAAPVEWLAERIRPMGRGSNRVLLHSVIPEGFPNYARILHPAFVPGEDTPIRWAEVAARNNKTVHPLMQFGRLSGSDDNYAHPYWAEEPFVGKLPEAEAKAIVPILRSFTTTPDRCYLLVWEGYGGIKQSYPPTVTLELPDRKYLSYTGPVDSVLELCVDGNTLEGPNLWWPEDRAWIVATEIDFMETYVGGTAQCINQLLNDSGLEAFPAMTDARVDFLSDTINV